MWITVAGVSLAALVVLSTVPTCTSSGSGGGDLLQNTIDLNRLQSILREGIATEDVTQLYYAVKGLKQLNANIPNICETIKTIKYDVSNIEQVFYLTNAAALSGCLNSLKPDILGSATRVLGDKAATIPSLYHAVYSLKAMGKGTVYDKEDGLKNLIQLLKKDDTPANYGYVFALCQHMGCEAWTGTHAEGALLAADESDARALHFEGGLPVTSMLLTTILRTFKQLKKPSPLTEQQRYKFAEYLVSRRSVTSPRGAALLLDAALALADDQPTPISISVKGKKYVTSEAESVEILVTDLVGRALPGELEVVAQSATRLADDVVVLSKQPLTKKREEPGTYLLNLNKIKSQYGLYKIAVSVGAGSSSSTAHLTVAVLGVIRVESAELGIGDVDGTTSPKLTTLTYPNALAEQLTADHMQKVTLKFSVRDQLGKPMLLQQAFLRVSAAGDAKDEGEEAVFVAEADTARAYRVEVSVAALAKHLMQPRTAAYSLTLMLGDAAAASPVLWPLGTMRFNFNTLAATQSPLPVGVGGARGGALPELSHQFRTAEARPPRAVSDVFACASAAPLLLLLLLWAKLRVNLSQFMFTPSALLFHAALGGSLYVYYMLWTRLSMFETVRYLAPLAALTFLTGHRLLRALALADNKR